MSSYQSASVLPKGATQSNDNVVAGAPALRALRDDDSENDNAVPGPSSQISSHGDGHISVVEARSSHMDIVSETAAESSSSRISTDEIRAGEEEDGDLEAEGSDETTTVANIIIPTVPTTEVPEEEQGPPPENYNAATGQIRGARHLRPRHRMRHQQQHPEQDQVVPQAQPQAPPAIPDVAPDQNDVLADNDAMHIVKTIIDYESRSVCKGSLALMPVGWILLYFPTYVDHSILLVIFGFICSSLACLALSMIIWKPDIRLQGPFGTFEVCSFQLIAITCLIYLLEFTWEFVITSLEEFLPLHTWKGSTLKTQVEQIVALPIYEYFSKNYYLAFRLNSQFFLTAISLLLLITCPVTLQRMASRNHQIREILIFETTAIFYPTAYFVLPFFVMNLCAVAIPTAYQSFFLWTSLHILLVLWTVFILYGLIHYPEIPIVRPLGIPGYLYMESVSTMQLVMGLCFLEFTMLARTMYFNLVPNAFKNYLSNPGFLLGPHLYFNQLFKEEEDDPTPWKYMYPYPPTYEFLQGLFAMVCIVRQFVLFKFMESIQDRLDEAMRDRVEG